MKPAEGSPGANKISKPPQAQACCERGRLQCTQCKLLPHSGASFSALTLPARADSVHRRHSTCKAPLLTEAVPRPPFRTVEPTEIRICSAFMTTFSSVPLSVSAQCRTFFPSLSHKQKFSHAPSPRSARIFERNSSETRGSSVEPSLLACFVSPF